MRDYIEIGSVPFDEDCAQTNDDNYYAKAHNECVRFRDLLSKVYPLGCFKIRRFPHDFGFYYEVVAYFDNEEEMNAAFEAEGCPYKTWKELEEKVGEI